MAVVAVLLCEECKRQRVDDASIVTRQSIITQPPTDAACVNADASQPSTSVDNLSVVVQGQWRN